jgi:nucleoid-associated protein YgaU
LTSTLFSSKFNSHFFCPWKWGEIILNSNLKKFLKAFKLNESNISMVLGALVIVIVGVLIVNYFKDQQSQTLPEALTTSNVTEVGKPHIVVEGETLWSIAEDAYGSGYNWTDVKLANNLLSEKIEVGQKLEIPDVAAKKPTSTTKVAEVSTVATTSIATSSYTVVKGDTLWNISVRAYGDGYKWSEIAKANKLGNPNLIHAGNVLTLPR